jgi:hypothetical protein
LAVVVQQLHLRPQVEMAANLHSTVNVQQVVVQVETS